MLKRDQFGLGIILGILAPLLGLLVYYFWKFYPTFTLGEFFTVLALQKSLISGIVSFALIANAILFTIYINTRRDKTAKGIFIITCIYAIAALVVKGVL
jgi:hypothetical protein